MPELPEVETVRLGLERRVLGRTIYAVEVLNSLIVQGDAARFRSGIKGRRIERIRRRGKTLALELHSPDIQAPDYLVMRLGMTGQLIVARADCPLLSHTHIRIALDNAAEELRYRDPRRFGMLRYCSESEFEQVFDALGPDALDLTEVQFEDALRDRRGAIKGWLLNQQILAGLGNIYADEALFEARIHPQTPAGDLPKPARHRLFLAIHRVLRHAVSLQGTSFRDYIDIEGNPGNFEPHLRAYGRTGQPCPRCGALIRRVIISGRSSHYCSRCQHRPRSP